MINDIADLDAFSAEFLTFLCQGSFIASLEREVIKGAWYPEPTVDAGVIFARHAGNVACFHEGEQLVMAGIKEDVTDLPPLFYFNAIAHHRFETEQVFVELARFVKIERRKANVRKSSV